MSEQFLCSACGQTCLQKRGHDETRGDYLWFERDEHKCLARFNGAKGGQQSELIKFALSDPQAMRCAFFQRLAQGCAEIGPKG